MFETQSSQLLLCFSVTPACIIVTSIKPESWSFYIKSFSKLFDLNRWKSSEPVGVTKHEEGVILLPGEDSRLTVTLTWRTSVVLSLQHNSSRNLQHVGAAAVASERLKLWTEIMQRLKRLNHQNKREQKHRLLQLLEIHPGKTNTWKSGMTNDWKMIRPHGRRQLESRTSFSWFEIINWWFITLTTV